MIKPLCEALEITANELLSGERIEKENIEQKSEENIINTLTYSKKTIKNTKIIFTSVLATIICIFLILSVCISIDISRMIDNKPVVFGTWGFKYTSPIELEYEKIELAVKNYLTDKGDSEIKHHENEKSFVALDVYLIEQREEDKYIVYAWVLAEKYYIENGEILQDSGSSVPYKICVEKQDTGYVVTDTGVPRDGSYYDDDIKAMFPLSVQIEVHVAQINGTYERLAHEIKEEAKVYFSADIK